ncbi:MAG: SRPBCC family protein [Solirubrobacterales bacterium]|nr:SRPBCC family protein [Solirubrobacterales bacterium]
MKVSRSRTVAAAPPDVWAIVGDPGQLARWWPRVERVESVDAAGFTEVYKTTKGRTVRADFRIAALEDEQEIRVVQQLEGTPFERIFSKASKRCVVAPVEGGGTKLTVELDQTPSGMARFGGFMVRGAMRKQLDQGLDALAELL